MENKVSTEEFIRAWQASKTHAEVARATGLSRAWVASRASLLRSRGVSLKKFRSPDRLDYEALAALARECEVRVTGSGIKGPIVAPSAPEAG